ncbi:MAG TPA: DUF481 domain-containing protein [Steroidobacteraceae bacterium]|nr:DUF481 domain-containing protein [Steroidobacteraceae bacterium]
MRKGTIAALSAAALLGSMLARADDVPLPNTAVKATVGVAATSGNTSTLTANAKFGATHTTQHHKDDVALEGLYGKQNGFVSAERWAARYQHDWKLDEKLFLFGSLGYERDLFSGFSYQSTAAVGAGYTLLNTDADKLSVQAGVGYRRLEPMVLVKDPAGNVIQRILQPVNGEAVGTGGVSYEHTFNASTKLNEKFGIIYGSDNTEMKNDIALQVKMSKVLALSLDYLVTYNSNPPAGLVRTDTITTFNLVYEKK